ncbi:MAG: hypothetical protein HYW28_04005 [Rhodospirillales bacterium]|nr:hypothetical protein [Rhodospirillales bacterium]
MVGFCSGPALASLAYGRLSSVLFVAAMLLGMALYRAVLGPTQKQAP